MIPWLICLRLRGCDSPVHPMSAGTTLYLEDDAMPDGVLPKTRVMSMRSMVFALDGNEKPYPVYQKLRRNRKKQFVEKPGHNPFAGL